MSELTINNRFALTCPEGFRVMSAKERAQMNQKDDGNTLCLTNEEGHMAVSIGWKEVGTVANLLLNVIRPVTSTEASLNRSLFAYKYRREAKLNREIGGQSAEGFRYSYVTGDVVMLGETYVIRQGRSLTFFHGYMPFALRDKSLAQWNRLLDAVRPL